MPKSYSEGLQFPPLLAPPPSSRILWSNNDLILCRANTLKSSRRTSLKCPHQLQTHLPKDLLSSLPPVTRISPFQRVISGSAVWIPPPLHSFYGSSPPLLFPSLLSNGILHRHCYCNSLLPSGYKHAQKEKQNNAFSWSYSVLHYPMLLFQISLKARLHPCYSESLLETQNLRPPAQQVHFPQGPQATNSNVINSGLHWVCLYMTST